MNSCRRKMNSCRRKMKSEKLMLCAIVLQLVLAFAFAFFVEYGDAAIAKYKWQLYEAFGGTSGKNTLPPNYYMFQDVHLMSFIGFGFLLMLIRKSDRNSALPSYFMVMAISLQWATLCYGFFHIDNGKILLDLESLLNADFTCAGVLISCASVVDIATPLQLIFMALFQIAFSVSNKWLCSVKMQASDVGSSMFVHVFGAYFGLAVGFALHRYSACTDGQSKNEEQLAPSSSVMSATVGTMFLWLLWPSFNACMAKGESEQFRAIINTYYSLSASCVTAFAVSTLLSICVEMNEGRKKFNMVLFQNSTLVGGVVIGTSADMLINIWGAMIVGGLAGGGSVIINRLLTKEATHQKLKTSDAWGVNALHGIPGIVAGLVGAIVSAAATSEDYGFSLYRQFPARSPINGSTDFLRTHNRQLQPGLGRTASQQAGYQIAALVVTLSIAVIGGLATGIVLLLPFLRDGPKVTGAQSDQFTLIAANDNGEPEQIVTLSEAASSTIE